MKSRFDVFGETFKDYSNDDMDAFIGVLNQRWEINGLDEFVFMGKKCLDAACGTGRGSIFMWINGAEEVTCLDISEKNLKTTDRNMKVKGSEFHKLKQGSLLDLPFEDETFDVVWCNGAAHHTGDTSKAIKELSRVLKVGGHMWLYIYGSGGVYWYMVDFIRKWLSDVSAEEVFKLLIASNFSTTKIAEFMDDWKAPVLDRYKAADLSDLLSRLGLSHRRLVKGTAYDTCQRKFIFCEHDLMGEGDLRYWSVKMDRPLIGEVIDIPVDNTYHEEVLSLDKQFKKLNINTPIARIIVSAKIQTWIRNEMSKEKRFNIGKFKEEIEGWSKVKT